MSNLSNMKQYPISRELFCEIFIKPFRIMDEEYNLDNFTTDNFKFWWYENTYYLLHLSSGTLITWYKHLGRCLEVNKDLYLNEYKYLAKLLCEDLKDLVEF